ncbi:hypothetical protein VRK_06760 [Vibrio sp. MEBiC08052]|nr:hypothetical protein VRK_06760 [Vibrio sp. MEBiC08052]
MWGASRLRLGGSKRSRDGNNNKMDQNVKQAFQYQLFKTVW